MAKTKEPVLRTGGAVPTLHGRCKVLPDVATPLTVDEVDALVRYAAEAGVDPQGTTLAALQEALTDFQKASAEECGKKHDVLISRYAALSALTRPVNGRTLLDTRCANRRIFPLFLLTLVLLVVAVGNEVLISWLSEIDTPEGGWPMFFWFVQKHVLEHISPFVWGGLGACVYLLKKLYDIAQDRYFDRSKLHGWFLRVILAAVLGAVVLYLFDPAALAGEGVPLDKKAVAFLVGLGVKVVYGALEKAVDELAKKLNLVAIRREHARTTDARVFLGQKLGEKAATEDAERQRVLNELLNELDRQTATDVDMPR